MTPFITALSLLSLGLHASALVQPPRINFNSLAENSHELVTALQTIGFVSITNVPALNKLAALGSLPECIEETSRAAKHEFVDGTLRLTIATSSSAPLEFPQDQACERFQQQSIAFRETIQRVSQMLVQQLASQLGLEEEPLLMSSTLAEGGQAKYFTLENILIDDGEHLEHFHAYYKDNTSSSNVQKSTIRMHVDQGLMLIFTPGMVNGHPTDGFYIELTDGSSEMVQFGTEDDLVVFFGDGIHQIINAKLLAQGKIPLRVLPHALSMPSTGPSPRVWYGTMMLPPPHAIHATDKTQTYGNVRLSLIEDGDVLSLGCSSPNLEARLLTEDTCNSTEAAYCWHDCMNYTDYNVSPEICAQRGLELACANADGFLWPGNIHDSQFMLNCVDLSTAVNYTIPSPTSAPPSAPPASSSSTAYFPAVSGLCALLVSVFLATFN